MLLNNLLSLHEAIVIALINHPWRTASFETIAKYIEDKNLYPIQVGNTSSTIEDMLRSTIIEGAYHHLFEQPDADYIMLRNTEFGKMVLLTKALDEILNHDYYFYHPFAAKLRVYDEPNDTVSKKEFSPEKVICVITKDLPGKHGEKPSGRKKFIYYEGPGPNGNMKIYEYQCNASMAVLKDKLDKFNFYLATVSDNAMVNVGYFQLSKGKTLVCEKPIPQLETIRFSESRRAKEYLQDFEKVQSYHQMRTSLQKKILDYKNQIRTNPSI